MEWELRDWRALAMGYGVGIAYACLIGINLGLPVVAIAATLLCRYLWR